MWLGRGTTVFMRNILRRPCQKANLIVCKTGTKIVVQYEECTIRINDCLTQMKKTSTKGESAKSAPSSKQSRLKDLRRDIKMKKLILELEQELAQFELDMEERKLNWNLKGRKEHAN